MIVFNENSLILKGVKKELYFLSTMVIHEFMIAINEFHVILSFLKMLKF